MTSDSPRGYSMSMVRKIQALDQTSTVAQFAQLCVAKDWSVLRIARLFGVSRMAVYNWFGGRANPEPVHVKRMRAMLDQVSNAQA